MGYLGIKVLRNVAGDVREGDRTRLVTERAVCHDQTRRGSA